MEVAYSKLLPRIMSEIWPMSVRRVRIEGWICYFGPPLEIFGPMSIKDGFVIEVTNVSEAKLTIIRFLMCLKFG